MSTFQSQQFLESFRHKLPDTGYWKWLDAGNYTGIRLADAQNYLKTFGFELGTHRVSDASIEAMRHVHLLYSWKFQREQELG